MFTISRYYRAHKIITQITGHNAVLQKKCLFQNILYILNCFSFFLWHCTSGTKHTPNKLRNWGMHCYLIVDFLFSFCCFRHQILYLFRVCLLQLEGICGTCQRSLFLYPSVIEAHLILRRKPLWESCWKLAGHNSFPHKSPSWRSIFSTTTGGMLLNYMSLQESVHGSYLSSWASMLIGCNFLHPAGLAVKPLWGLKISLTVSKLWMIVQKDQSKMSLSL